MSFLAHTGIATVQLILGFLGFWLVWRVLLPVLPDRRDGDQISPFAGYITAPLVRPLSRSLHLPDWLASTLLLVALAAVIVALDRLAASLA